jgi:hypothetical protein
MDMADWLADNLSEAREWLCADDSTPEWKRFTRYVLGCEGHLKPDNTRVTQREALTRKVVRGLYVSDARLRQPLGPNREGFYDLHHHRLLHRRDLCRSARVPPLLRNVTSMLPARRHVHHPRPAQVHGVTSARRMVSPDPIHHRRMLDAMLENGFVRSSMTHRSFPCRTNNIRVRLYSGLLTASARRLPRAPESNGELPIC